MYFNNLVIQFIFISLLYYVKCGVPDVKAACAIKLETCEFSRNPRRPVCASDGQTYATRCELLRVQCSGQPITVAHKGPCIDENDNQSACHIALQYALKTKGTSQASFVPRCRADGSFAAVQCAAAGSGGGCWCVNPLGKRLSNTAVRTGRPDCTKIGKSHTRRRSSSRAGGQRNKKHCNLMDRAVFNSNLLKIFGNEYDRARSGETVTSPSTADPHVIAEWKFKELDRNRNGDLQKSEYRGLRRLIKKVVIKPKRCARAWTKNCDENGDGIISKSEWISCLLSSPEPLQPDYEEGVQEPERDYESEDPPLVDPTSVLPGSLMRGAVAPEESDTNDNRRDDDINDCHKDRQAVLDEQKAGGSALYVPECTGDGRYARAQCYKSTGYCWCVHQDTGKPIPGSSVKDRRPDCDTAPQHTSPMKGCPEPMKANFLRDLKSFFLMKMMTTTNGTVPGIGDREKWSSSREEHAATWVFVLLDKDKNKVVEKREWKAFQQLIANAENLRKCGRKLPRYCDVNHDNRISITEWLACLDVTRITKVSTTESTTSNTKRRGKNPLESILKAD